MLDPLTAATSYSEEEILEGKTLQPAPTEEQDALWDEIYDRLTLEDFDRREKFINLTPAIQAHLASAKLAREIGMIGKQFALEPWQAGKLAKVMKYVAIGEYRDREMAAAIMNEVKVSSDIAQEIEKAVRPILKPPEEGGVAPGFLRQEVSVLPGAPRPPARPEPLRRGEGPPKTDAIEGTPSLTREPAPKTPGAEDQPFMIHEEKPLFSPAPRGSSPTFSFKSSDAVKKASPPSPAARVDTPQPGGPTARVVHYSSLRTLLDGRGSKSNIQA